MLQTHLPYLCLVVHRNSNEQYLNQHTPRTKQCVCNLAAVILTEKLHKVLPGVTANKEAGPPVIFKLSAQLHPFLLSPSYIHLHSLFLRELFASPHIPEGIKFMENLNLTLNLCLCYLKQVSIWQMMVRILCKL